MDLGITGRRAIVCAASKGLGKGCAMALAGEGVAITTPEGREATLAACPDPDILVNNSGGPPPGNFRDWGRDEWIKALDGNMLTAIELIRATIDGNHWGRRTVQPHSQGADHPWPA